MAKRVGLNPALGTIFPIFINARTPVACDLDHVQAACCVIIEHTMYMYICKYIASKHYMTYGGTPFYKPYNSRC